LTGLLFLHPIFDNRTTHLLNYTHVVEKLCGTEALQLLIFVTTMWDTVISQTGKLREEELWTRFWKSTITSGSRMARFDNTCESAWGILDQFTGVRCPLQLQTEMVDEGKSLMWTAAGSALFGPRGQQIRKRFVCCLAPRNFHDRRSSDNIRSSRHPFVQDMVDMIANQCHSYCKVIQMSVEIAPKGCSFARDAIDFFRRLVRAEDSFETLKSGLDNIKEVAKIAHHDSKQIHRQFKNVRVELFKVRFFTHPHII